MSQSARSPGVLLSVRWGEQELAREFLPLDVPRAFTIGSEPGCDFSCGGARTYRLIEIDEEGAALRHKDGKRALLERGAPASFQLGALDFEAQLVDAPRKVRAAAAAELTTVNLSLMLLAAFGFFAVAAANADAEGDALADDLSGAAPRLVKLMLQNNQARQASASAAAPRQQKDKPTPAASPSHKARTVAPSRPAARPTVSKADVGSLFRGPGAASIFGTTGLGDELRAASTGLRTAAAGDGLGVLGSGHGLDGNGTGGLGLASIGHLGTRSGRGPGYGPGVLLRAADKPEVPKFDEPVVEGCAVDGSGCLDKELIRQVIRRNLSGFRYCYESRLNRFPGLEGKVSVRFSITPSGKVTASNVAQSTAGNPELEQCVSERTRLLQFPAGKWNGLVVVTYPFLFKQSGK